MMDTETKVTEARWRKKAVVLFILITIAATFTLLALHPYLTQDVEAPLTVTDNLQGATSINVNIPLTDTDNHQGAAKTDVKIASTDTDSHQEAASANVKIPSTDTDNLQEAASANVKIPSTDTDGHQGAASANVKIPSTDTDNLQEAASANVKIPSTDNDSHQGAASANVKIPSTDTDNLQEAASANVKIPSTDTDNLQEAASANVKIPSTDTDNLQEAASRDVKIPSTDTDNLQEAASANVKIPSTDTDNLQEAPLNTENERLRQWKADRQKLLAAPGTAKVFLASYMRGGSSILGELFNQDQQALLWYEPLDAFYSAYFGLGIENIPQTDLYLNNMTRRALNQIERDKMESYFTAIFECRLGDLPPQAMSHYFLSQSHGMAAFNACYRRHKHTSINSCNSLVSSVCGKTVQTSQTNGCHLLIHAAAQAWKSHQTDVERLAAMTSLLTSLDPSNGKLGLEKNAALFLRRQECVEKIRSEVGACLPVALEKCHRDAVIPVEVNRIKIEDLEPIILANPDIHVVYYTRDPRAISYSREHTRFLMWDKADRRPVREARFLCSRMGDDWQQKLRLEKKYPDVFLHMRYELLVSDPVGAASQIYGHFGKSPPASWRTFAQKSMHAQNGGKTGHFGVRVANAKDTAERWKQGIPRDQLLQIDDFCGDLLQNLGYPKYSTVVTNS